MIYLDHHATTPVAPLVLEAMLPYFRSDFANPGSTTHAAGRDVAVQVQAAIASLASRLHVAPDELVMTSGATESNNLAILGTCLHPRQLRRKVVTVVSEHRAVLDPIKRLERFGFEVVPCPVTDRHSPVPGLVDWEFLASQLDHHTALVSIMLANNEIGVIQPLAEIARLCQAQGILLHTDATQAVGQFPIAIPQLGVDLLSFSAHKFYGPKGIGALFVRQDVKKVRVDPQILGGGHQQNRRSGTLNVPGIIGMAKALELCLATADSPIRELRNQLWQKLTDTLPGIVLNGPPLSEHRLANNLNCQFPGVEGASLMLECPELAVSSGSACTSTEPHPSHVLLALGLNVDEARSSLRFGLGRDTTIEEIDQAVAWLKQGYDKLRRFA